MSYYNEVTGSMSDTQELAFLTEILHQAHAFLDKWKEFVPRREETTEDAFVAITELAREVRLRRDWLVKNGGEDTVPF